MTRRTRRMHRSSAVAVACAGALAACGPGSSGPSGTPARGTTSGQAAASTSGGSRGATSTSTSTTTTGASSASSAAATTTGPASSTTGPASTSGPRGSTTAASASSGPATASSSSGPASTATSTTGGATDTATSTGGPTSTASSGGAATTTTGGTTAGGVDAGGGPAPTRVFVISLENQAASDIYGSSRAPYLNNVVAPMAARATHWADVLPLAIESAPHYVWMEAGTNVFPDHSFLVDADPSATESTASTDHLVTQIEHAGKSWRVYMEGIDASSGACPINSNGTFAAWHNPTTWFRDVSGNPPSTDNASCAAHHRDYSAFAPELAAGTMADFTFIVPDLCHDMHGLPTCPDADPVQAGDHWLSVNLPPILDAVNRSGGVVYLLWDETSATNAYGDPLQPFYALGPGVKKGYASPVLLDHSAYLKTVEEQLGLPILPSVQNAPDLSDLFVDPVVPAR